MWRNIWSICLLFAALGIGLASPVMAWTSYSHGSYGSGYRGEYLEPPTRGGSYSLGLPPPIDQSDGYTGRWPPHYGPEGPSAPYGDAPYGDIPQDALSPAPVGPGYGSRPYPLNPGGRRGFGGPAGFQIWRETSDDAYLPTIALNGMAPETTRIRTQGHWIFLSRPHLIWQTRKDRSDDGRGSMYSFSYSSGTTNQQLTVPPDAILNAMSRENGTDNIRLRIPRRGTE